MTMIHKREGTLAGGEWPGRCRGGGRRPGCDLRADGRNGGGDQLSPPQNAGDGSRPVSIFMVAIHKSGTSIAGFWKTGLLAANAFRIFLAFIFKNALVANNGIRGIADF